ncbi:hypothetical protein EMEDMD4_180049 [Sinorhizobium medicae]|uniref:Uncharacterized protein n=1 Tax=Sinorhizobium medicae TaxID=110321 RepID=A0A508WY53_9HYPH|nr:hypothetical protein EMEDMD4_180049 [Sinorhizobium medicae]
MNAASPDLNQQPFAPRATRSIVGRAAELAAGAAGRPDWQAVMSVRLAVTQARARKRPKRMDCIGVPREIVANAALQQQLEQFQTRPSNFRKCACGFRLESR